MWIYLFHLYCLSGSYAFNAIFYNVFLYFWEALDFFSILSKSERLGHHSAFLFMETGSDLEKFATRASGECFIDTGEVILHYVTTSYFPLPLSPCPSLFCWIFEGLLNRKELPLISLNFKPIYKDFMTDKKKLSMELWIGKPHSLIVLFILAVDSNKIIHQERRYTSAFYFIFLK